MWFQATYSQCLYSGGLSDNPTIGFHLLKQAHVLGSKGKPSKFRDTFIFRRSPRLILPSRTSYSIEAKERDYEDNSTWLRNYG
ncbi:hypothetical protein Peur_059359 [Populus x canadensis]